MIELMIAGGLGLTALVKSRRFVHKRLRFTKVAEHPAPSGLAAGAATTIASGVVVSALTAIPLAGVFIGPATALGLGAGVGTGVALGASKAKKGPPDEDF